jgi:transcriptional regulator with XRE-family HTH domain
MARPPKHEWPSRTYRASSSYRKTAAALGSRVRALRMTRGWTLERSAEATNLDPTQLAKIEAGTVNVTRVTIVRIADGLGVSVRALFPQRAIRRVRLPGS